jgi:hypothetical protein
MNGPKVGRKRCLREIWLYAGNSENPALLHSAVTMRRVRTISRKGSAACRESSETIRQTLSDQVKRWSHLHGDMQGGETQAPPPRQRCLGKVLSEIPCRVSSDPHEWRNEMGAVSATYSAKLKYL